MDETTLHVRAAREGDATSLAWLVARFGPVLLAQARYRLGRLPARLAEPEDVVQEVWARALPRLGALEGGPRQTPTLVRFLSTTLLHRVNELTRAALRGGEPAPVPSQLPAGTRGALTRVGEDEATTALLAAVEELPDADRAAVVMRGLEQQPLAEVAAALGVTRGALSLRYNRALRRLRERLPDSVFAELDEENSEKA